MHFKTYVPVGICKARLSGFAFILERLSRCPENDLRAYGLRRRSSTISKRYMVQSRNSRSSVRSSIGSNRYVRHSWTCFSASLPLTPCSAASLSWQKNCGKHHKQITEACLQRSARSGAWQSWQSGTNYCSEICQPSRQRCLPSEGLRLRCPGMGATRKTKQPTP